MGEVQIRMPQLRSGVPASDIDVAVDVAVEHRLERRYPSTSSEFGFRLRRRLRRRWLVSYGHIGHTTSGSLAYGEVQIKMPQLRRGAPAPDIDVAVDVVVEHRFERCYPTTSSGLGFRLRLRRRLRRRRSVYAGPYGHLACGIWAGRLGA